MNAKTFTIGQLAVSTIMHTVTLIFRTLLAFATLEVCAIRTSIANFTPARHNKNSWRCGFTSQNRSSLLEIVAQEKVWADELLLDSAKIQIHRGIITENQPRLVCLGANL